MCASALSAISVMPICGPPGGFSIGITMDSISRLRLAVSVIAATVSTPATALRWGLLVQFLKRSTITFVTSLALTSRSPINLASAASGTLLSGSPR
jgi:hypothetical protein